MRISFEWEWENPIPGIKQTYKELVCRVFDHQYEKYVKPKATVLFYEVMFLRRAGFLEDPNYDEIPDKQCKRCGKIKYKKVERKSKPKTIKFARYSPLKTATVKRLKRKRGKK